MFKFFSFYKNTQNFEFTAFVVVNNKIKTITEIDVRPSGVGHYLWNY